MQKERRNTAISTATDDSQSFAIIVQEDHGWIYFTLSILGFVGAFFVLFAIFGAARGLAA